MNTDLMAYMEDNLGGVLELIKELCKIPAPTHQEKARAEYCAAWMEGAGYENAHVDAAYNAVCSIGVEADNEVILLIAHTDTVFPDLEPLPMYEENGKLYCPGVGDNTGHVAMLLYAAKYFLQKGMVPPYGVVFSANSCEEGGGNKGIRQLMETYKGRVREVISIDGNYDFIYDNTLASAMMEITAKTEGGHAYNFFGNRSAVHVLSSFVTELYKLKLKEGMSYNVGVFEGGKQVNAIPEEATIKMEYRAANNEDLDFIYEKIMEIVETHKPMAESLSVEKVKETRIAGKVDLEKQRALARKAKQVVWDVFGEEPKYRGAMTDCVVPLAMGVPAVCFGTYSGGGAHSRGEWLDLDSIPKAFEIVMKFIATYFEG